MTSHIKTLVRRGLAKNMMTIVFLLSAMSVAEAQTGTWSGKLEVQGTKLSLVFHLDGDEPSMDSPDQGARGIPVQVDRPGAGKVTIRISSLGASYEGVWMLKQIVGTFRQMNMAFPLTLKPGEEKPDRPQTPVGPFPYSTEEITFNNDGTAFSGTLTLPEGYSRETPVLVMITGSGIQNRDEEIFSHKPFAVIADALARAGIATLRYDDRGFHGYSGDINACTVEDFKRDAMAGVSLLRERFDKVGAIGHSEGGTIAIMLAAEGNVDLIVSLAGMAVSGAETLLAQNRTVLKEAGIPEETIDSYCRLLGKAFNVKVNGGVMPDPADYDLPAALAANYKAATAQLQMPYMSHFLALDMRPLLGKIACPVLALNGTKDTQVDHEDNLGAIREGLPPNPANRVEEVEGLNHLFQHCTTGAVAEYKDIEETFAPEVLGMMISWIQGN